MLSSSGPRVSTTRSPPGSLWTTIACLPPAPMALGVEKPSKEMPPRTRVSAICSGPDQAAVGGNVSAHAVVGRRAGGVLVQVLQLLADRLRELAAVHIERHGDWRRLHPAGARVEA